MTRHVARYTFATQTLNRDIPVEVFHKLMGHTDIQTTRIYAKMLTSTLVKEMELAHSNWNKLICFNSDRCTFSLAIITKNTRYIKSKCIEIG